MHSMIKNWIPIPHPSKIPIFHSFSSLARVGIGFMSIDAKWTATITLVILIYLRLTHSTQSYTLFKYKFYHLLLFFFFWRPPHALHHIIYAIYFWNVLDSKYVFKLIYLEMFFSKKNTNHFYRKKIITLQAPEIRVQSLLSISQPATMEWLCNRIPT